MTGASAFASPFSTLPSSPVRFQTTFSPPFAVSVNVIASPGR